MEFNKLKNIEQEDVLMPLVLSVLRKLGGSSSRSELMEMVVLNSDKLPDNLDKKVKVSRNGNEYHPFAFTFNFAIANLAYADFISIQRRSYVELTEKGRTFDISKLNIRKDVRDLADPKFQAKTEKNKSRKIAKQKEVISDTSDDWRIQLNKALMNFTPAKFELFARSLVKNMGVTIDETKGVRLTGDGGIDGFGYLTSDDFRTTRVAIQAKRWKGSVSSPDIDKFRGAMDKNNAEYGIFISTSEFTRDAVEASRTGTRVITLIDGNKIADLVAKYEIRAKPVTTYELDDEFYGSED